FGGGPMTILHRVTLLAALIGIPAACGEAFVSTTSSSATSSGSVAGTGGATTGTGGATTGTSGSTTGTGGAAVEQDCTNGLDDDGDGSTDCEDPDCSDFSCVPAPPAGWASA